MKKILLFLALVSLTTVYGQTKWHEQKNDYFVEQAAKEYNLSADKQKELKKERMKMVTVYLSSNKALKNGEITKQQRQEKTRKASKEFNSYFAKLVGKPYAEVAPFLKRIREELRAK